MAVPWSEIAAHRERLVRIARRRCPSREDAEDVVQEAMLRSATFEDLDEARVGPFLTAVTIRLCADVYRHADRDARAVRRLGMDEVPGPEVAAVAAAEAAELRALLDSLPTRQRDVLVDRAEGLSVTQISARHALTYKATESTLSRARATMRLALASAMGAVAAAFGFVRRRPAAVLAVPLVAASFVTTVHHGPLPYAAPEVRTVPIAPPRDAIRVAGETPVAAPARAEKALPAVTNVAAVRRSDPVRPPDEDPEKETIVEVDNDLTKGEITQDSDLLEDVARCATAESYSVDVEIERSDPPRVEAVPHCNP